MLFLCRLCSWIKCNFIIKSHFTAAIPGLIVSELNFNFSCYVHNHGFCFLQDWRPTVPASSGHHVLLKLVSITLCPIRWKKMCKTALRLLLPFWIKASALWNYTSTLQMLTTSLSPSNLCYSWLHKSQFQHSFLSCADRKWTLSVSFGIFGITSCCRDVRGVDQ